MNLNMNTVKEFFVKVINSIKENCDKVKKDYAKHREKALKSKVYLFIEKASTFIKKAFMFILNELLSLVFPKEAEKILKTIILIVGCPVCLFFGFQMITSGLNFSTDAPLSGASPALLLFYFNLFKICAGFIIMAIPKFVVKNLKLKD